MKKEFVTNNYNETQKLGEMLAEEIKDGRIICMIGELGSGKTTFTQGLLKGLKVKGPYTSPTFVIMKQYHIAHNMEHKTKKTKMLHVSCSMPHVVYHIDAYRVKSEDIINLGWEEMIKEKNNVIIIEWADRIEEIIPSDVVWIKFEWLDENRRKISFQSKF